MSDDTFQGWTNRETWALNLWLTNDQSLYELTRERVAEAVAGSAGKRPGLAGIAVQNLWEELTDPSEGLMSVENILTMVRDIGSEYRVNWDEIGASWLEDLDES